MIEIWKNVLMKPKDVFKAEKANASVVGGLKMNAIAGLIAGAAMAVQIMLLGAVLGPQLAMLGPLAGMGAIGALIGMVLFYVVFTLLFSAVTYIFAKLLGGKGSFSVHYYLPSLAMVPVALLTNVLGLIPIIGLLSFIVSIYSIYLMTLAYQEAHGFDTLKAVLTWLIPGILLVVVMAVVLGTILMALLGGGALAAGAVPKA